MIEKRNARLREAGVWSKDDLRKRPPALAASLFSGKAGRGFVKPILLDTTGSVQVIAAESRLKAKSGIISLLAPRKCIQSMGEMNLVVTNGIFDVFSELALVVVLLLSYVQTNS
jgi:hypothetical protein